MVRLPRVDLRHVLVLLGAALLVLAATVEDPMRLRVGALVVVTGTLLAGIAWRLPVGTAIGVLCLVAVVALGPAASAGALALAGWAAPTWVISLVAIAALDRDAPTAAGARMRARLALAPVVAGLASIALVVPVVMAGTLPRPTSGWAAAAGIALAATVAAGLRRRGRPRG